MRPQLQAAISVYRSGKLHPGVGHRLQSPDITRCIRGVANDEEWHRGLYPPVSFDNKVGVVLWFQSAHVEEECPAFEAESFYELRTLLSAAIRSVGDHHRRRIVAVQEVVRDDPGIRNGNGGKQTGQVLGDSVKCPAGDAPLSAFSLNAVNVERYGNSAQAGND